MYIEKQQINNEIHLSKSFRGRKDLSYNNILNTVKYNQQRQDRHSRHLKTMETQYIDEQQHYLHLFIPQSTERASESKTYSIDKENYTIIDYPQPTLRVRIQSRLKQAKSQKVIKRQQNNKKIVKNTKIFTNLNCNPKQATFRPNERKIFGDNKNKKQHQYAQRLIQILSTQKSNYTIQSNTNKQNQKKYYPLQNLNFYERQNRMLSEKEKKCSQLRTQRQLNQIKECTFKPKLTKYMK